MSHLRIGEFYRHLDDHAEILDSASFGSSRASISHGRILRCKTCTFGFRQVRSSADELSEIYRKMDSSLYESEVFGRFKTATRHFRMVKRLCPPGRILDVGCASGLFLDLALQEGWSGAGLEPSETLSRKAQALLKDRAEIQQRTLEQAEFPPHSFDVITLWDVLEHVPLPVVFLKQCNTLLKPGATSSSMFRTSTANRPNG
jgi:2-polyprenyl-3-methyl-5-hydroxy-6-metoxy-1,4-benzoquinol methylase